MQSWHTHTHRRTLKRGAYSKQTYATHTTRLYIRVWSIQLDEGERELVPLKTPKRYVHCILSQFIYWMSDEMTMELTEWGRGGGGARTGGWHEEASINIVNEGGGGSSGWGASMGFLVIESNWTRWAITNWADRETCCPRECELREFYERELMLFYFCWIVLCVIGVWTKRSERYIGEKKTDRRKPLPRDGVHWELKEKIWFKVVNGWL